MRYQKNASRKLDNCFWSVMEDEERKTRRKKRSEKRKSLF